MTSVEKLNKIYPEKLCNSDKKTYPLFRFNGCYLNDFGLQILLNVIMHKENG